MLVSLIKQDLHEAAKACSKVAAKSSIEHYMCTRLEAKGDHLTLEATDGDKSIKIALECFVETGGVALVSAQTLESVTKALKGDTVTIEMDDEFVIKSANSDSKISHINPEMFPAFPKVKPNEQVVISAAEFNKIVEVTSGFIDPKPGRPILDCVHIECADGIGNAYASDTFRAIRYTFDCKGNLNADISLASLKTFSAKSDDVTITHDGTMSCISDGITTITSRNIDGNYPNVNRILDDQINTEITELQGLNGAIKRVLMANASPSVRLLFNNNEVTVVSTGEKSSYKENVSCKCLESAEISANTKFLNVALSVCNNPTIGFISPTKPIHIRDENIKCVVMPIRL